MRAFTLIEVVIALAVVSSIITSVLVVMNRCINATINMELQRQAFKLAREQMETLLSKNSVSDLSEYGFSEETPEIDWQMTVEPFYEPISNQMWVRAVSAAGFTDTTGQRQKIEFACWLTGLTAQQVKQILDQQKREQEFLAQMSEGDYEQSIAQLNEMTIAYLNAAGLDSTAYQEFIEKQKKRKMDYVAEHGYDQGYVELLDEMMQEENEFLGNLGMNFDRYNEFIRQYTEQAGQDTPADQGSTETPSDGASDKQGVKQPGENQTDVPKDQDTPQQGQDEMAELRTTLKQTFGWSDEQIDSFLSNQ